MKEAGSWSCPDYRGLLSIRSRSVPFEAMGAHGCLQAGLLLLALFHFNTVFGDDPLFSRPIAIAISANGSIAYIANQETATIVVVDAGTHETRSVGCSGNGLSDIVCSHQNDLILAVSKSPSQIQEIDAAVSPSIAPRSIPLPGVPEKLAISLDGRFVCITMTWNHAACILTLKEGRLDPTLEIKLLPLTFQPKEVLALEKGLFLIADAFGGQLSLVDANTAQAIAGHEIRGHHIEGLARDESNHTVAITHQRLSSIAHTTRDDIHWGILMQNVVSVISQERLVDPRVGVSKEAEKWMIGEVGNGSADPSGVLAWDGRLVVAIAGTNQIAVREQSRNRWRRYPVDQSPTRLARLSDSKLLWISTLGDTANIMEWVDDRFETIASLGVPREWSTAEERGEAAFFSGQLSHDGWMSCSSCHVNGHSPDLLADTRGDGLHDTPKRIPSLRNVSMTGPWTWSGREPTLEGQIAKTLESTMHRDTSDVHASRDSRSIAGDIAAYLAKPNTNVPKSTKGDQHVQGSDLFEKRGCSRCHQPSLYYTSPDNYDVGVLDEAGESKFNPPSLIGFAYRKAFLHDARHRNLADLLRSHPDSSVVWTPEEILSLSAFLTRL